MQNQTRERILLMPEEKWQDSDSVAAPSDIVTKEDDKVGSHGAREQNRRKKRERKGKRISTIRKSSQRYQCDNNREDTNSEEMFETKSPIEQRRDKVHSKRSVNCKESASPTDSSNKKDDAAPMAHEQSPSLSRKEKNLAVEKEDAMVADRSNKRIKVAYPKQDRKYFKKSNDEQVRLLGDIEDSGNEANKHEQNCQLKLPDVIESIHQHGKQRKFSGNLPNERVKRIQKRQLGEMNADESEQNEGRSSKVDSISMASRESKNNQILSKTQSMCKVLQGSILRRCEKFSSPFQCAFCHSSNDTEVFLTCSEVVLVDYCYKLANMGKRLLRILER